MMQLRQRQLLNILLLVVGLGLLTSAVFYFDAALWVKDKVDWIPVPLPGFSSGLSSGRTNLNRLMVTTTETTLPMRDQHAHGFTIMDNLYLRNKTFYVVTSNVSAYPPRRNIISRPVDMGHGAEGEPTDKELQFLDLTNSTTVLGDQALVVDGLTIIVYDTTQFLKHYYHWWGEIMLGAWRVYSGLALMTGVDVSSLPFPSRLMLPHIDDSSWRDHANVNGPLMRNAFPNLALDRSDYWDDFTSLNRTVVFERVIVVTRETAHRSSWIPKWYKMISGTMNITVPEHFWEPIRHATLWNLFGYIPKLDSDGIVVAPPEASSNIPIITYISRQGGRRRLTPEAHNSLVQALEELERDGVCEVQIAQMELLSLEKQLELVSRSTILVGVHGNGLTHQLWMQPSPRSTVIEILYPKAYVFDYEMLARNMGHRHYAAWNDTLITYPKDVYPELHYGEHDDFHGTQIPVHGPAVAQMIRQRLIEKDPN